MHSSGQPSVHRTPKPGYLNQGQAARNGPESRTGWTKHQLGEVNVDNRCTDPKRQRSTSATPSLPEGLPFACPYSKHDPHTYSHKNTVDQDYRNCSTGYWTSIARLKQHLYRTHDRSQRCCPKCWQNFPNDDHLRKHIDSQMCEKRPMPVEKMSKEQHNAVKERDQGKPIESWMNIYHILFGRNAPLPVSPYAEWVTGQDLRVCFDMLDERLPELLFRVAASRQPQLCNVEQEDNTVFPTTTEVIQRMLEQCKKEFGSAMGLGHVLGVPTTAAQQGASNRGTVSGSQIRPNPGQRPNMHSRTISTSSAQLTRQMQKQQLEDSSSSPDEDEMDSEFQVMHSLRPTFSHGTSHGQAYTTATVPMSIYNTGPYHTTTTAPSYDDIVQAGIIQNEYLAGMDDPDHDWS